ncbi:cytochrome-c oxidase, cbb3-type subunit III [Sphingomonas qomolangmaensis]|uniref:Cbb3-type cytochrome c oxidase subunit n=1 Tax=Sphingomonas qomolangmaensis TaxID=2918765 RepID=A0ABY5LH32_9SPHN|nr:cytochrome-c oxidase, cbb3-type subunit III [Sphingomonas qomolangmaensis]UUL84046.1 cytochrome-c oxidase, cbb3-type subunit III [Sphingomonas qomolangmaensis]
MAERSRIDDKTGTPTVGHEWDGIEELDTPMPRWWLWTLYASIVFAIGYVIAYPAIPMLNSATKGVLGWSSQGELDRDIAGEQKRRAPIMTALAATPLDQLAANPKLLAAAEEGGRSVFKVHCAACHGAGAAGSKGYPNLNDDDWLWGGDMAAIEQTLIHGIRHPGDVQTRISQMPAFGRDGILQPAEIDDLVSFVRVRSGQDQPSAAAARGGALYTNNCAACHGEEGRGNRTLGAPNLTDSIWLFGGDRGSLTTTLINGRGGIMPAWEKQLDPVTIKMLAAYVHSLGGGEASPAPTRVAAAPQRVAAKQ